MIIKNIQSVRGMHDYLPDEVMLWQKIEQVLIKVLNSYGYKEIRFPIIESTQLFKRSIGQITDIVEKEMYSFNDHSGNGLTLRPEGTSGCIRAGIEHSLFYNNQEQRLWYLGPMFRHERPQKGRYRQFHQFGVEAFGYAEPEIDLELILITVHCWKALGIIQYLNLELNSIGSVSSRIIYCEQLVKFLKKNLHYLNFNDINRLYSNPLRILDTKNNKIKQLLKQAPVLRDYLDHYSKDHFDKLCKLLDLCGVSYTINPYLVRGLDYYNRTVFEWVTNKLGIKKTVCAGGRYDELVNQLGGEIIPAIGFAIGLERILLLIKIVGNYISGIRTYIDIYIICLEKNMQKHAILLSKNIREKLPSLRLMVDYRSDNLKKQFSRAVKQNTYFVLIMNQENMSKNIVFLKDLQSGQKYTIKYDEIIDNLNKIVQK